MSTTGDDDGDDDNVLGGDEDDEDDDEDDDDDETDDEDENENDEDDEGKLIFLPYFKLLSNFGVKFCQPIILVRLVLLSSFDIKKRMK